MSKYAVSWRVAAWVALVLATRGAVHAEPATVPLIDGAVVAFLGDSITHAATAPDGFIALVSNAVHRAMPRGSVRFLNAGKSGNRINDLQARLEVDVLVHRPTVVVVLIGVNDAWLADHGMGTTPPAFEAGLRDVVARCRAAGARPVLCTPLVHGEKADGSNRFDATLDTFAALARRVAAETETPLVDLRQDFLRQLRQANPAGLDRGVLTLDGVHPNAAGNRLIAAGLLRVFGLPPSVDEPAATLP